jgi:NAD-dependent SIR2 family protein deacetylase
MDKTLKCVGCGKNFLFTEAEQKFYEEKGFTEPKRCKECRQERKRKGGIENGGKEEK